MDAWRLARGLGWFSIGIGAAELLAPRALARAIGTRPNPPVMRLLGARELATGIGILSKVDRHSGPGSLTWLGARVAGDVVDLALLTGALALASDRPSRRRLAAATAAVAGVTVLDVLGADRFRSSPHRAGIHVSQSVTINRPASVLYEFWRNPSNLPRIMPHVHSVVPLGGNRWHWAVRGPAGVVVEWDAEVTEERPNELIAWRSLEGAAVAHEGTVRFESAPAGRGTTVRTDLRYDPPAGSGGAAVAKLLVSSPEQLIRDSLRPFKQLMETGEVATTEGQPAGRERPRLLQKFAARAAPARTGTYDTPEGRP